MKGQWSKRKALLLTGLLFLLLLLCGCAQKRQGEAEEAGLKVTFFDVGKGDAILIEAEEQRMLIDAGYDDTADSILAYLEEQGIYGLDYLVLTHFDKDHVGGADHILEAVEVGEVLQPDYESDSKQYREYRQALEQEGMTPVLVTQTTYLSLGGAGLLLYPPQQEEYEEEDNDFSLVISMTYGTRRFLFAGDCEKERLSELLAQEEFDLSHDLLKVPHHGRKEKNSEEFLRAVSPEIAVITCSEEQPADDKILRILHQLSADVYQTAEGTLTCLSDGSDIWVMQQ